VIELVVLDAVQLHRRLRRHHEIKRRAERAAVGERCGQTTSGDLERARIGFTHEAAGGIGLKLEQLDDLVGGQV
jgi:hypothetical protein